MVEEAVVALAQTLGLQRFELHAAHPGHAGRCGSAELLGTWWRLVAERLGA